MDKDKAVAMVCADVCLYGNIHKYVIPKNWNVDEHSDEESLIRALCAVAILRDAGIDPSEFDKNLY